MPYIKRVDRQRLDHGLTHLGQEIRSVGELHYVLERLCQLYIGRVSSYGRLNDAVGALECAKLELYRRVVAPYEDRRRAEHGDDVFGP